MIELSDSDGKEGLAEPWLVPVMAVVDKTKEVWRALMVTPSSAHPGTLEPEHRAILPRPRTKSD